MTPQQKASEFDQIYKELEKLERLGDVAGRISMVMADPHSTQEDFDRILAEGFKTLEKAQKENTQ